MNKWTNKLLSWEKTKLVSSCHFGGNSRVVSPGLDFFVCFLLPTATGLLYDSVFSSTVCSWGYRSDSHAWKGDSTKNQAVSLKALFYIKTKFLQANNNKKEQTRTKRNPPTVYNCDQPDSFENLGRTPNAFQANSVGLHLPLCRRHVCTFCLFKKNFG